MSGIDLAPFYAGKGSKKVTHTLEARQDWRQVGWLGLASNEVYSLDDPERMTDPAGYQPLWILAENEAVVLPDDASCSTEQ